MKIIFLAVTAALTLIAGAAIAGKGEGEKFPFRAPGLTTAVNFEMYANTASEAYPDFAGYPTQITAGINPRLA